MAQDQAEPATGSALAQYRRPRVSDERAPNDTGFMLRTGNSWEELPQELRFGQRRDLPTAAVTNKQRHVISPASAVAGGTGKLEQCLSSW